MTTVAIVALVLAAMSIVLNVALWVVTQRQYWHIQHTKAKITGIMWRLKDLLTKRIEACPSHEALKQVRTDVERHVAATLGEFERTTIAPLRRDGKRVRAFVVSIEKQVEAAEEHMDPKTFAAARKLVWVLKVLGDLFPRRPRHQRRERDARKGTEELPGAAYPGLGPS